MLLSRFAIYFDEVARRGSIRRASEVLNIAPSAIHRQILQMEDRLGVPLFERLPQSMRLTAAGEVLVVAIRRWRRDIRNIETQIDELRGLRRGEVNIAMVEGGSELVIRALQGFRAQYPGIDCHLQVAVSEAVVERVASGGADLGVAFNPPDRQDLRISSVLSYQIGVVMRRDHPLATRERLSPLACSDHPLVGPDDGNALRAILDRAWFGSVGAAPRFAATASSISLIKSLVLSGVGIGFLTPIDVATEVDAGLLCFVPLEGVRLPVSVLTLITASGRSLSTAASLLLNHLALTMTP